MTMLLTAECVHAAHGKLARRLLGLGTRLSSRPTRRANDEISYNARIIATTNEKQW
jgi:hypothetical protein